MLASRAVGAERKRELIELVLSWMREPTRIPDDLAPAFTTGIAIPGAGFNTHRYWLVEFLIKFARTWKNKPPDEQSRFLDDPWAFKKFVFDLPLHAAQTQREALLHLVHPEAFEPIVSQATKQKLVDRLGHLSNSTTEDIDQRIAEIRRHLEADHGDFGFWDPQIAPMWQDDESPWGRFIAWARRFVSDPAFDALERDYKLEVAAGLGRARDAVLANAPEWPNLLRSALTTKNQNLVPWQATDSLIKWCASAKDSARKALTALWHEGEPPEQRVTSFVETVREAGITPHVGISMASILLMADEPTEHAPYRKGVFKQARDLLEIPSPAPKADAGEHYAAAMRLLDDLEHEAEVRGLSLRDRLDAQSALWAVLKGDFPESFTDKDRRALARYRGAPVADDEPATPDGASQVSEAGPEPKPRSTLDDLAERLLMPLDFLQRVERLLRDKRQIVFHGPPGTGKTYVAQQLARHLAEDERGVVLTQFHPSYAYEDFVEGYRPSSLAGGQPGFALREGPLKTLARRAAGSPERTFVLVIDELNRGNVAKVFGELYFLLEYRNDAIRLQYSDEEFQLPKNLWFIATMNTADRSIALVDAALRRRFHFVPFFPDQPPVQGLLGRWLDRHRPELRWVADAVDLVNRELDDRNLAIGPSHFIRENLDNAWIELIWQHSVLPYLEEQMFGDDERLATFRLDAVRQRMAAPAADMAGS